MALADNSVKREQAALLLADDRLSDEQIAEQVGIGRTTLHRWKGDEEFQARVKAHVDALASAALSQGIAQRWRRLRRLNRDWERMQRLIEARAESMADDVPGGETGLLAHDQKGIGQGPNAEVVDVYRVDTALLSEMRATEKQAAEELGQWIEKSESRGLLRVESTVDLSGLSDEELSDLDRLTKRIAATGGGGAGENTPRVLA